MGVILVNTAEDYPEDKAAGMQTSIVALGLSGGIRAAFCLAFIGGVALFSIFITLFLQRQVPLVNWSVLLLPAGSYLFVAYSIGKLSAPDLDHAGGLDIVRGHFCALPRNHQCDSLIRFCPLVRGANTSHSGISHAMARWFALTGIVL